MPRDLTSWQVPRLRSAEESEDVTKSELSAVVSALMSPLSSSKGIWNRTSPSSFPSPGALLVHPSVSAVGHQAKSQHAIKIPSHQYVADHYPCGAQIDLVHRNAMGLSRWKMQETGTMYCSRPFLQWLLQERSQVASRRLCKADRHSPLPPEGEAGGLPPLPLPSLPSLPSCCVKRRPRAGMPPPTAPPPVPPAAPTAFAARAPAPVLACARTASVMMPCLALKMHQLIAASPGPFRSAVCSERFGACVGPTDHTISLLTPCTEASRRCV